MTLHSRQVENSISDYFKEALAYILNNKTLYLLVTVVVAICMAILIYLPKAIRVPMETLVGIFLFFWVMEVTFSSTQERLNISKLFKTVSITFYTMYSYFAVKKNLVILLSLMLLGIVIGLINGDSNAYQERMNDTWDKQVLFGVYLSGSLRALLDIAIISYFAKELISDKFVYARASGNFNMEENPITQKSLQDNMIHINRMWILSFVLSLFSLMMLGWQNLIFVIVAVAITLYSMDVFRINKNKKNHIVF